MKIEIGTKQVDFWLDLVLNALVAVQAEREDHKIQMRDRVVARENKWRRFVPFLKRLPHDLDPEAAQEYLFEIDRYYFDMGMTAERERILRRVRKGLVHLTSGDAQAVTLSDREVTLIRRYAKCEHS